MIKNYRNFYGFNKEPFSQNVPVEKLYERPGLNALKERFLYAVENGQVTVITGEIGSGKSTSLRYVTNELHPSKYLILSLVATTGSVMELLKQMAEELGLVLKSNSIAKMTNVIRQVLGEYSEERKKPIFLIDEAHLLRPEVFSQLHTFFQWEFDSKTLAPIILCGQSALIDKLKYQSSAPIASRVLGRSHLESLKLKDMEEYLIHHLQIAGIDENLFEKDAMIAIHQGSGGLLRKANYLAKGALIAGANEQTRLINAELVRIASSELI